LLLENDHDLEDAHGEAEQPAHQDEQPLVLLEDRVQHALYRGSRTIRRAIFELRLSFLANYIQTMLNFSLNYY
jgi:hypothetical protein